MASFIVFWEVMLRGCGLFHCVMGGCGLFHCALGGYVERLWPLSLCYGRLCREVVVSFIVFGRLC